MLATWIGLLSASPEMRSPAAVNKPVSGPVEGRGCAAFARPTAFFNCAAVCAASAAWAAAGS